MNYNPIRTGTQIRGNTSTYTVGREIAQCGSARVFRGASLDAQKKEVVIKTPKFDGNSETNIRLLKREARIMKRTISKDGTKHPNIVELLDNGEHTNDKIPFLVLEDLGDNELKKVIDNEGPLKPRTAIRILKTVLETIHFLAKNGVFHKDIKPENLIYVPKRGPVLIDFGISEHEEEEGLTEDPSQVFGTPLYMPIEIANGGFPTIKSEVFSAAMCAAVIQSEQEEIKPRAVVMSREFFEERKRKIREFLERAPRETRIALQSNLSEDSSQRQTAIQFAHSIERILNPGAQEMEYRRIKSDEKNVPGWVIALGVSAGFGALAAEIVEKLK